MERTKKPKTASGRKLGILNPYGDVWTHETFDTEEAARAHIHNFWAGLDKTIDLTTFKVVPVRVTVSANVPPPSDAGGAG